MVMEVATVEELFRRIAVEIDETEDAFNYARGEDALNDAKELIMLYTGNRWKVGCRVVQLNVAARIYINPKLLASSGTGPSSFSFDSHVQWGVYFSLPDIQMLDGIKRKQGIYSITTSNDLRFTRLPGTNNRRIL